MGDEPALIEAIRKDNRVRLSDDEIIDLMADAMFDEETEEIRTTDPQKCLDRLTGKV